MKNDDIRQLRVNDGVSLRGHVSKVDGDKVLITFPEISNSLWVWERNVHQDFFVRSAPPEERRSYDALKHVCERQKARLEAAENLLHGIRYNMEHLEEELTGLALKATSHTTMLSEMCYDMIADKIGGGYQTNCCKNVGNAHKVAAGCLGALEKIKIVMMHFEEKQESAAGSSGVTKGGEA